MRLAASGALDQLPDEARQALQEAIDSLAGNTGLTLNLALAYGGRQEILHAALHAGPSGCSRANSSPTRSRGRVRQGPVLARTARSRPGDPHQRRGPAEQFPALADGLFRNPHHARCCGPISASGICCWPWPTSRTGSAVSAPCPTTGPGRRGPDRGLPAGPRPLEATAEGPAVTEETRQTPSDPARLRALAPLPEGRHPAPPGGHPGGRSLPLPDHPARRPVFPGAGRPDHPAGPARVLRPDAGQGLPALRAAGLFLRPGHQLVRLAPGRRRAADPDRQPAADHGPRALPHRTCPGPWATSP